MPKYRTAEEIRSKADSWQQELYASTSAQTAVMKFAYTKQTMFSTARFPQIQNMY